jgi:virulence-associated protein VagC
LWRELPGDEAIMHRDGDRLVIEPVRKHGLIALLKSMTPAGEEFPQVDDPVPAGLRGPSWQERALARPRASARISVVAA